MSTTTKPTDTRRDGTPALPPAVAALLVSVHDPERKTALADAWHERMAICTIDGGKSEADAARVAWRELVAAVASDEYASRETLRRAFNSEASYVRHRTAMAQEPSP